MIQDLLLQLLVHKSTGPEGIHPTVLKEQADVMSPQKLSPLFFNSLGSLEKSHLSGSWQMLPQF